MRLADDIALLERAAGIAGQVIWSDAANISVPDRTLRALIDEVEAARLRPTEYALIRYEALWLIQAASQTQFYRADGNAAMAERWEGFAQKLSAAVQLDLLNARKSLEAFT